MNHDADAPVARPSLPAGHAGDPSSPSLTEKTDNQTTGLVSSPNVESPKLLEPQLADPGISEPQSGGDTELERAPSDSEAAFDDASAKDGSHTEPESQQASEDFDDDEESTEKGRDITDVDSILDRIADDGSGDKLNGLGSEPILAEGSDEMLDPEDDRAEASQSSPSSAGRDVEQEYDKPSVAGEEQEDIVPSTADGSSEEPDCSEQRNTDATGDEADNASNSGGEGSRKEQDGFRQRSPSEGLRDDADGMSVGQDLGDNQDSAKQSSADGDGDDDEMLHDEHEQGMHTSAPQSADMDTILKDYDSSMDPSLPNGDMSDSHSSGQQIRTGNARRPKKDDNGNRSDLVRVSEEDKGDSIGTDDDQHDGSDTPDSRDSKGDLKDILTSKADPVDNDDDDMGDVDLGYRGMSADVRPFKMKVDLGSDGDSAKQTDEDRNSDELNDNDDNGETGTKQEGKQPGGGEHILADDSAGREGKILETEEEREEREKQEQEAGALVYDEQLKLLRTNWMFASTIQFLRVFMEPLKLRRHLLNSDLLEGALMRPWDHRLLLGELLFKLLRSTPEVPYSDKDCHRWEAMIDAKLRQRWQGNFESNPLEEKSFFGILPSQRMRILYLLCEWRIQDCPAVKDALKRTVEHPDYTSDALRHFPIGEDSKGNTYYYFAIGGEDCRMYCLEPTFFRQPRSLNRKTRSSKSKKGKKRGREDEESDEDDLVEIEEPNWTTTCTTLEEMQQWAEELGKSRHPLDKSLYQLVTTEILPKLEETANARKRALEKQMLYESMPKKRSSRISQQQQQKEEEAKLAEIRAKEEAERRAAEEARRAEEERLAEKRRREAQRELRIKCRSERAEKRRQEWLTIVNQTQNSNPSARLTRNERLAARFAAKEGKTEQEEGQENADGASGLGIALIDETSRAKRKRFITRRQVAGVFQHKAATRADGSAKRCNSVKWAVKMLEDIRHIRGWDIEEPPSLTFPTDFEKRAMWLRNLEQMQRMDASNIRGHAGVDPALRMQHQGGYRVPVGVGEGMRFDGAGVRAAGPAGLLSQQQAALMLRQQQQQRLQALQQSRTQQQQPQRHTSSGSFPGGFGAQPQQMPQSQIPNQFLEASQRFGGSSQQNAPPRVMPQQMELQMLLQTMSPEQVRHFSALPVQQQVAVIEEVRRQTNIRLMQQRQHQEQRQLLDLQAPQIPDGTGFGLLGGLGVDQQQPRSSMLPPVQNAMRGSHDPLSGGMPSANSSYMSLLKPTVPNLHNAQNPRGQSLMDVGPASLHGGSGKFGAQAQSNALDANIRDWEQDIQTKMRFGLELTAEDRKVLERMESDRRASSLRAAKQGDLPEDTFSALGALGGRRDNRDAAIGRMQGHGSMFEMPSMQSGFNQATGGVGAGGAFGDHGIRNHSSKMSASNQLSQPGSSRLPSGSFQPGMNLGRSGSHPNPSQNMPAGAGTSAGNQLGSQQDHWASTNPMSFLMPVGGQQSASLSGPQQGNALGIGIGTTMGMQNPGSANSFNPIRGSGNVQSSLSGMPGSTTIGQWNQMRSAGPGMPSPSQAQMGPHTNKAGMANPGQRIPDVQALRNSAQREFSQPSLHQQPTYNWQQQQSPAHGPGLSPNPSMHYGSNPNNLPSQMTNAGASLRNISEGK